MPTHRMVAADPFRSPCQSTARQTLPKNGKPENSRSQLPPATETQRLENLGGTPENAATTRFPTLAGPPHPNQTTHNTANKHIWKYPGSTHQTMKLKNPTTRAPRPGGVRKRALAHFGPSLGVTLHSYKQNQMFFSVWEPKPSARATSQAHSHTFPSQYGRSTAPAIRKPTTLPQIWPPRKPTSDIQPNLQPDTRCRDMLEEHPKKKSALVLNFFYIKPHPEWTNYHAQTAHRTRTCTACFSTIWLFINDPEEPVLRRKF